MHCVVRFALIAARNQHLPTGYVAFLRSAYAALLKMRVQRGFHIRDATPGDAQTAHDNVSIIEHFVRHAHSTVS